MSIIARLMRVVFIVLVFFLVYMDVSAFAAQTKDSPVSHQFADAELIKDTLIPDLVEHEGSFYVRDKYWKEYEEAIYADLDGDSEEELIVRFRTSGDESFPTAITVIYGLNKDGRTIAKTILGGETPNNMELSDIDKDGIKDLILYDNCGNHYTLIMIYSYKDNDYKCIFENGTACYAYEVNTKLDPARITIGREDWEKEDFSYMVSDTESLLEVWEWDGEKFTYSPSLSTSSLLTEEEAIEATWQNMKRTSEMNSKEMEFAAKAWTAGRRYLKFFKKEVLR